MSFLLPVPWRFSIFLCAAMCLRLGCASVAHAQTVVHDLFAMSVGASRLTRIDGRTGAVVYSVNNGSFYATLGPDGLLYTPSRRVDPATGADVLPWRSILAISLDFGPDGNLYAGW